MHVKSTGILSAYPDTYVKLRASRLHAPLIERALELPFDIYEGASLKRELRILGPTAQRAGSRLIYTDRGMPPGAGGAARGACQAPASGC